MTKSFKLTEAVARKVLDTVDQGLTSGLGVGKPGSMCVEAAVCFALGLPHGDDPGCVDPAIRALKITLNDSQWSSKTARANGMRKLALLQLGTKDNFDAIKFAGLVAMFTVTKMLPRTLRLIGLESHAKACEIAKDLHAASVARLAASDAASVARLAASDAASVARLAARLAASDAASDAARLAASDAASDKELIFFADGVSDILISMGVEAVKYLHLLSPPHVKS